MWIWLKHNTIFFCVWIQPSPATYMCCPSYKRGILQVKPTSMEYFVKMACRDIPSQGENPIPIAKSCLPVHTLFSTESTRNQKFPLCITKCQREQIKIPTKTGTTKHSQSPSWIYYHLQKVYLQGFENLVNEDLNMTIGDSLKLALHQLVHIQGQIRHHKIPVKRTVLSQIH